MSSQGVPFENPSFPGVAGWTTRAVNKVALEVSPVTGLSALQQAEVADQLQYLHGAHDLTAYQLHLDA